MTSKLREAREASRLSQRELAEKVHTPQSIISDFERGMRKPWPKVAQRLSEVLEKPIETLFPDDFSK